MNGSNVSFTVTPTPNDFQILNIHIGGNGVIVPEEIRTMELPILDYSKGIVINGKAPVWLYACLSHKFHIASWVACFDPRFGALIVQTHSPNHNLGDIISLEQLKPYLDVPRSSEQARAQKLIGRDEAKVIAFVGPPHSGKSVLLYALKLELQKKLEPEEFQRHFFIVRGCPDGEGDWFHETDQELVKVIRYKGRFTDDFVDFVCKSIEGMEQTKRLLFVDCGGRIDRKNQQIWNRCTHAIIVSSKPEDVAEWAGAVKASELTVLAIVQSTLQNRSRVLTQDPLYCELGPLERGKTQQVQVPNELLKAILADTGLKTKA